MDSKQVYAHNGKIMKQAGSNRRFWVRDITPNSEACYFVKASSLSRAKDVVFNRIGELLEGIRQVTEICEFEFQLMSEGKEVFIQMLGEKKRPAVKHSKNVNKRILIGLKPFKTAA
jgi:hypothetical protein